MLCKWEVWCCASVSYVIKQHQGACSTLWWGFLLRLSAYGLPEAHEYQVGQFINILVIITTYASIITAKPSFHICTACKCWQRCSHVKNVFTICLPRCWFTWRFIFFPHSHLFNTAQAACVVFKIKLLRLCTNPRYASWDLERPRPLTKF